MGNDKHENGFNQLDRKLGKLWGRIWGTLLLILGLGFAVSALSSGDLVGHWPKLVAAAVLLLLARACFRSRESLLETLSETHISPGKDDNGRR